MDHQRMRLKFLRECAIGVAAERSAPRHLIGVALLAVLSSMARAQAPTPSAWVPTQSAPHVEDYAGSSACASCHRRESRLASASQMGLSISLPTRRYPDAPTLEFQRGRYSYTLVRDGEASLTVSDGKNRITAPIFAMIGAGDFFQSYLLRYDGIPYRAAVDLVTARGGLDLDSEADPPASIEDALGRHHSERYVRNCFSCHSPASVAGDDIDFVHRPLGNTCEVCHGPGAKHAELEEAGKPRQLAIFNPGRLSPAKESDFCGQCHTTAAQMRAENAKGTHSVISEPYRLETSRCWNVADRRIRCTACHNPHAPIVRDTAAYDIQCKACHTPSKAGDLHNQKVISICAVGKRNCAGCHMQPVAVSDTPIIYRDHRIRILKKDAPFPE